jgi:hypothetical protein
MLASVTATITINEPTISPCPHASSTSPLGSVGRDEYALSGIPARDRQSDQFEDHDQLVSGYERVATMRGFKAGIIPFLRSLKETNGFIES